MVVKMLVDSKVLVGISTALEAADFACKHRIPDSNDHTKDVFCGQGHTEFWNSPDENETVCGVSADSINAYHISTCWGVGNDGVIRGTTNNRGELIKNLTLGISFKTEYVDWQKRPDSAEIEITETGIELDTKDYVEVPDGVTKEEMDSLKAAYKKSIDIQLDCMFGDGDYESIRKEMDELEPDATRYLELRAQTPSGGPPEGEHFWRIPHRTTTTVDRN